MRKDLSWILGLAMAVVSGEAAKFNLLLVHTPGKQDVADFLTIRNMMLGKAPDIDVFVVSLGQKIPHQFLGRSGLPALIFSAMPISLPNTVRGRLLSPPPAATKHDEYIMLKNANLPTPPSCLVTKVEDLLDIDLGEIVVIKPNSGRRGGGVTLIEAASLKTWSRETFEGSPSNRGGMVVQRYVAIRSRPASYRVMTVLGEAVYCAEYIANANVGDMPKGSLAAGVQVASNVDDKVVVEANDADVISLAREVHRALDFTPVMGIDIVRDATTGELYVLELNSAGMTWHLSSDRGKALQRKNALNYYDQFNALKVITDRLIIETRLRAA